MASSRGGMAGTRWIRTESGPAICPCDSRRSIVAQQGALVDRTMVLDLTVERQGTGPAAYRISPTSIEPMARSSCCFSAAPCRSTKSSAAQASLALA